MKLMYITQKELIMCLAYRKIFWMGMGVRGKGKAFFSKKVSPSPGNSISLPCPPSSSCTSCASWLNQHSCLKALRMPDQREGNYVGRPIAQPTRPNRAATPGCPLPASTGDISITGHQICCILRVHSINDQSGLLEQERQNEQRKRFGNRKHAA